MISIAIILFVLAMLLGLYLVYIGIRQHRGSTVLALTHAAMASTALGLLIVAIYQSDETHKLYNAGAFLFVMAFIGGVTLFALREDKKPPAMFLVMLHAVMAVIALFLLVKGFMTYA